MDDTTNKIQKINVVVSGLPGVGKSTILKEIYDVLYNHGFHVTIFSTSSAPNFLHKKEMQQMRLETLKKRNISIKLKEVNLIKQQSEET